MSGRNGDHDSSSGKGGTNTQQSNTRTDRGAAISEKSLLARLFDPRKISPACGKFRTQLMRAIIERVGAPLETDRQDPAIQ
jgi:hypothetical protein